MAGSVKEDPSKSIPGTPAPDSGGDQPGQAWAGGLGLPDDRILAEISHEMGNYFHKLYFWTDKLREATMRGGLAPGGAVENLAETVERLEQFMRLALEYFAPARLRFDRIPLSDIAGGLEARLQGKEFEFVGLEKWRDTQLLVDPALVSHALGVIVDRVASTMAAGEKLVMRFVYAKRRDFKGMEMEFRAGSAAGAGKGLTVGIEMTVAEKCLQMHGGELFERSEGCDLYLVIFLPLYA